MDGKDSRLSTGDHPAAGQAARGVLLIVCFALFFGVLNASAVAVVLPDIADDLSVYTGQLSWLMTGFLLIYGIAIPFYGCLADRFGARRLFLLGVGIFSVGSLLSALAPNFSLLLVARVIQAAGGAAVPGLGMTLASRAYGPESRGTVLGVIVATIGVGGGVGPLLGGALSESWGWQSIFFVNVAAAIAIPLGFMILPRDQDLSREGIDLLGGLALALMVSGALLVPSEAARSGWLSSLVLTGAVMSVVGLLVLTARQLTASSPFIPKEFLQSSRYVALAGMSFSIMAAFSALMTGLPVMLTAFHDLSALEVGLTMLPGAILTSIFGVLAGRITDRKGPRLSAWIGAPLMLLAVLGLSASAGSQVWVIAMFVAVLGAGFGLVNTPLPTAVSNIVRGQMLASALSINSMLFFLGGGLGTAVLMAVATSRGGPGESPQPLALGCRGRLQRCFPAVGRAHDRGHCALAEAPKCPEPVEPESSFNRNWVPNCSVPWVPQCEEHLAVAAAPARVG